MSSRYQPFDPFILAKNFRQVNYVKYSASRINKHDWCVAIKTKPRGCIKSNEVEENVPYQVEQMSQSNKVDPKYNIVDIHMSLRRRRRRRRMRTRRRRRRMRRKKVKKKQNKWRKRTMTMTMTIIVMLITNFVFVVVGLQVFNMFFCFFGMHVINCKL